MVPTDKVIKKKAQVISSINDILVKFNKEPLNTNDFDILYDLSIDELYNAQEEVRKHLHMLSFQEQ